MSQTALPLPPEPVAASRINRWLLGRRLRWSFWLACAWPLADWARETVAGNPDGPALIAGSGLWAQWLLLATLAVTPLRRLGGLYGLQRWRRGLGLWACAHATLHLGAYAWFDARLIPDEIVDDLIARPAVAIGLAAFALMLPLALSANNAALRRLGAASWRQLHGLVYSLALLAALHQVWLRPGWQSLACALLLALLLGWRLRERFRARKAPQTLWQQGGCGCR